MFYADYWADRIEAAPTLERRTAIMRMRDAALHCCVIDGFAYMGGPPPHLRRKQHLQRRSKGKRTCGRMRSKD